KPRSAPPPTRRRPLRSPRVILAADDSRSARERLIAEVGALMDAEALTVWAGNILPQKNQLVTSDAEAVEEAFAEKLRDFGAAEVSQPEISAGIDQHGGPVTDHNSGTLVATMDAAPKLNGRRILSRLRKSKNRCAVTSEAVGPVRVIPIGKTLRLRDRDH